MTQMPFATSMAWPTAPGVGREGQNEGTVVNPPADGALQARPGVQQM